MEINSLVGETIKAAPTNFIISKKSEKRAEGKEMNLVRQARTRSYKTLYTMCKGLNFISPKKHILET